MLCLSFTSSCYFSYPDKINLIKHSWGQYWGEMGFLRLLTGKNLLGIESSVAWATPGQFTVANNFPCGEGGGGCGGASDETYGPHFTQFYKDPSTDIEAVQRRLREGRHVSL